MSGRCEPHDQSLDTPGDEIPRDIKIVAHRRARVPAFLRFAGRQLPPRVARERDDQIGRFEPWRGNQGGTVLAHVDAALFRTFDDIGGTCVRLRTR